VEKVKYSRNTRPVYQIRTYLHSSRKCSGLAQKVSPRKEEICFSLRLWTLAFSCSLVCVS